MHAANDVGLRSESAEVMLVTRWLCAHGLWLCALSWGCAPSLNENECEISADCAPLGEGLICRERLCVWPSGEGGGSGADMAPTGSDAGRPLDDGGRPPPDMGVLGYRAA